MTSYTVRWLFALLFCLKASLIQHCLLILRHKQPQITRVSFSDESLSALYYCLLSCNTIVFHITSCLCGKYPYRTEIEWNKLAFIKWRRQKACISPFKVVLVAELTNSVFWDTSLDFKHLQYKQSRLTLPETNNLFFSSLKMIETLKK